jgi:outer membrane protein assembly factor BamD
MRFFTPCFILVLILSLSSCSSIEKIQGADKAETYFLRGEAYLKEGMYDQALEKFSLVKNKFPYSKYAIEAELRIADTYYDKESYLEAQKLYSLYSEFHPQDKKRDYAIFRSGMSYYQLLPSAIDRDLGYAKNALVDFKTLMDMYSDSLYFKDALNKYTELKTRLAEKEIYIGNFYKKRKAYEAAVARYKTVIDEYPDLGFDEKMYYEVANCYVKLNQKEEANYYVDMLLVKFPTGEYSGSARKLKEGLN